jgi:hypothetical protein
MMRWGGVGGGGGCWLAFVKWIFHFFPFLWQFSHFIAQMLTWILIAVLYAGWMMLTNSAKYSTKDWGPDWLARAVAAALGLFLRLFSVTGEIILDDESMVTQVKSAQQFVFAASPHGVAAVAGIALNMPNFRLDSRVRHLHGTIGGASVVFLIPIGKPCPFLHSHL